MTIAKLCINPVIMRGKQYGKLTKGRNFTVLRARTRWCAILQAAVAAIGLAVPAANSAETFAFDFVGPGVSGSINLSYGPTTDAKYPSTGLPDVAYEVTGITGFFSDANNGLNIVNAPSTGLVPLYNTDPLVDPKEENLLAPNNFSKFFIANGNARGRLTFDNLFWPNGSPATASGPEWAAYKGGFLDVYGLMFNIEGGYAVNFWNVQDGDYGLAVATSEADPALRTQNDYLMSGVSVVPEPSTYAMALAGLACVGYSMWRRRKRA